MWQSMLGQAVGAGFGMLNSYMSNLWAKQREDEARAENYKYGEMQAENADARTRALYQDLQSPSALLQQYKDAGLSPAIMFGNGGGAGGSLASGAQGSSAAVAPTTYGAQALQGAELALMQAQIKKTNAEADNINKNTAKTQAEIDNIIADTGNKELEARNLSVKNVIMQLEQVFLEDTYNDRVAQVKADYEKAMQETKLLIEETGKAASEKQISIESANSIIEFNKKRVIEISAKIALAEAQTQLAKANVKLTNQQAEKLLNDIFVDKENLKLNQDRLEFNKEELEAQVKQWAVQNGLTEKQQTIAVWDMILSFITGNGSNFIKGLSAIASAMK